MFRHVALFTWSDEATDAQRRAVVEGLAELAGAIPGIRDYRFGSDVGMNPENHEFAVVADFDDRDAYLVYRDHPAHRALVAKRIAPILASRAAVQFEAG